MAEEHKRQELEIMKNRRKFEEKLKQDRLKHIREAQMTSNHRGYKSPNLREPFWTGQDFGLNLRRMLTKRNWNQ